MPPKKNSGGGGGGKSNSNNKGGGANNNNSNNKRKGGGKDDAEFDNLLKELSSATEQAGANKKTKGGEVLTQEEKRQKHREMEKTKASVPDPTFLETLERQQKERQLQQMLQQLMAGGMGSPFQLKCNKDFSKQVATTDKYDAAAGWMQGWRNSMEDAHIVNPSFISSSDDAALFSVFDGHAGAQCSHLCETLVTESAKAHYNSDGKSIAFDTVYREVDGKLRKQLKEESGSTAVTVLATDKTITCANVGDSRAVLCRAEGEVVELSHDHKPEKSEEKARIERLGGFVSDNRTNGQLAMSRALGDFSYKTRGDKNTGKPEEEQLVTCVPEIITVDREPGDEFLVLACDGIFDVLTNAEVVAFVREHLQSEEKPSLDEICHKACLRCLAPESAEGRGPARPLGTDNMTITIVKFRN